MRFHNNTTDFANVESFRIIHPFVFSLNPLSIGSCGELLPLASQALFQLTEQWRVCEAAESSQHSSLIPTLFTKLLQSLSAFVNTDNQPLTVKEQDKVDKVNLSACLPDTKMYSRF